MSEPKEHAAAPAAPAPAAPEHYLDVYQAGDRERAQQLLDERNARGGITSGEGVAPVGTPPVPEPEIVNGVAGDLRNALGAEGEAIIHEWGGEASPNFAENLGYLKHAVEHITRYDPGLMQLLSDNVEDEHGNVSQLGNNPALIRAAAEYGRLLAHRDGTEVSPTTVTRIEKGKTMQNETPSTRSHNPTSERRHYELTRELHAALSSGDKMGAALINAERTRLSNALWGNQPIVGSGGRDV
jgi:hypothetical protein